MPQAQFPPDPRSAKAARHFLRESLAGLGTDSAVIETAALLTSELVTNAFLHARSDVTLSVELQGASLRVSVDDDSPQRPVRRQPDLDSLGGRGMTLVDSLATAWGVVPHAGNGKTVWFELSPSARRAL